MSEQATNYQADTGARPLKLYELADEFRQFRAFLEQTDEDPLSDGGTALAEALFRVEMAFEAKCQAVAAIRQEYLSTAAVVKAEIDRLAARHARLAARAEWLKGYLLMALKAADVRKVEGARFTISIRLNNEALEVVELAEIPRRWIHVEITETVDKAGIKAWMKETGQTVPGTRVTRGERVEVR